MWNKTEAQIFHRLVLKNTRRKRRWKSKRGWHWQIQWGQTKEEQNLMKGDSSDLADKVMTVNYTTLQKYTLAINKYIIVNTDRPQTSTLREEWPLKGSSRLLKHSLTVCEVVNETVAAEAVSTWKPPLKSQGELACVLLCCRHVSTGTGRKRAGCFLWLVQTSPADNWDSLVRETLLWN